MSLRTLPKASWGKIMDDQFQFAQRAYYYAGGQFDPVRLTSKLKT